MERKMEQKGFEPELGPRFLSIFSILSSYGRIVGDFLIEVGVDSA
jgi:hypothetical protein